MNVDPELLQLFKAESEEHLAHLDEGLLRLEKSASDPVLLEELFREAHSLKGAARMLGLSRIEGAAHKLESQLNAARKGEAAPDLHDGLNQGLVDLRRLVAQALAGMAPPTTMSATVAPTAPAMTSAAMSVTTSAPMSATQVLPPPQPTVASDSAPEAARPASAPLSLSGTSAAAPETAVQPIARVPASAAPARADAAFVIETVRVDTRKLDALLTQVGELTVLQGRGRHRLDLIDRLQEEWSAYARDKSQRDAASVKHMSELLKQARDTLYEDDAHLEALTNQLSDHVSGLRLLPLSTIFALFPRTVHDLSREQGKEVELQIEGGDVAVDKRIVEAMKDPLMHLIRNAIDHGIEAPEQRERAGKPRAGSIRLTAARDGGKVSMHVTDDGRGLDVAAIRRAASRHGMHDEKSLAEMTTEQMQQLIFQSGFSTSEYVTELSGRGVGLDVVRTNVERLKGQIHLSSRVGQGLDVHIQLPIGVATVRLMVARVGNGLYGLPIEGIQGTRRIHSADIFSLEGSSAVMHAGRAVQVARLADLLQLPAQPQALDEPRTTRDDNAAMACIVLQIGQDSVAVLADDLLSEENVLPKPLGMPLRRVRNVSALAILGNGEICPILDMGDLLRAMRSRAKPVPTSASALASNAKPHSRIPVLLAEDSALVRAMEKRILEDAGYEVTVAVDGLDALNQIGTHPFAALISDIVMPHLDGLTLTERLRAQPRFKDLPIILVTTLSSDEDKRRGLEAGANAYLPKPTFDQRILLDALNRLV